LKLRKAIRSKFANAGIASISIERAANKAKVVIATSRPGIIIGRRGAGEEQLKAELAGITDNELFIDLQDVRKAESNAQLVAEDFATQLERRVAFRRAMKKAVTIAMKFGAKGIRVHAGGRLGGAEIAREEMYREGRVPLHTLRADIEYGTAIARTTAGSIGIKCWIFKGEVLPQRRRGSGQNPNVRAER
jgi:small subunit ribosomal protein S3